jgi:hypothetical protein
MARSALAAFALPNRLWLFTVSSALLHSGTFDRLVLPATRRAGAHRQLAAVMAFAVVWRPRRASTIRAPFVTHNGFIGPIHLFLLRMHRHPLEYKVCGDHPAGAEAGGLRTPSLP